MSPSAPKRLLGRQIFLLLPFFLGACTTISPSRPDSPAASSRDNASLRRDGAAEDLAPALRKQIVRYTTKESPGTVIVDPANRFLYLVLEGGKALRYGVGVGREGMAWSGTADVALKREWPRWTPTRNMIAREPEKYTKWSGGMDGGPDNPLGARALYLFQGGKDTLYRIHGTNEPWSIGTAMSSGCIRMMNDDVIDLYRRVPVGAKVVVLPAGNKVVESNAVAGPSATAVPRP